MGYTARFLWQSRYLDEEATLSAASSETGYPVGSLQDQLRARRWRSSSITSQYLQVDFGEPRPFNALALIDHNFTFEGTVAVTASDSPGGSDLLNLTGVALWNDLIGYGEDRYGYLGYGGKFAEADRTYLVPRPLRVIYLADEGQDEPVEARYVRLTFTDADNADGYFECGRLLVGLYDDFGINFSAIRHEVLDDSDLSLTPGGGQQWGVVYPPRMSLELNFDYLDYHDKYWNMLLMGLKMGMTNNLVIDAFPNNNYPSERHWGCLYGHFSSLPRFDQRGDSPFMSAHRSSAVDLVFEEAL